jgi:hypothetical protein
MAEAPVEADAHSCCVGEIEEAPPADSIASSKCDCGREAPAATAKASSPSPEISGTYDLRDVGFFEVAPNDLTVAGTDHESAPPPSPPAFLIACAFLI